MVEPYRLSRFLFHISISIGINAIPSLRARKEVIFNQATIITLQEIMKEKMPNLDPNTVSVKAKPKENTEQVH